MIHNGGQIEGNATKLQRAADAGISKREDQVVRPDIGPPSSCFLFIDPSCGSAGSEPLATKDMIHVGTLNGLRSFKEVCKGQQRRRCLSDKAAMPSLEG